VWTAFDVTQRADEVTHFCHLLQPDDAPSDDKFLIDHRHDVRPSKTSTTQRVNKVLDELVFTEQQYVKVIRYSSTVKPTT